MSNSEIKHVTKTMTNVGKLTLLTETRENLSINTSIVILDAHLKKEDLFKHLEENLIKNPKFFRFSSKVDLKSGEFEQVEVDINQHVNFVNLKDNEEKNEKSNLVDHLSNFLNIPLNMNLPLWEIIVVENYSEGTVLFWRIHHVLGDGTAMGFMFASLCNAEPKFELPKQNILTTILMNIYFYLWIIFGSIFVIFKWTMMGLKGTDPIGIFKKKKLGIKKRFGVSDEIKVSDAKLIGKKMKAKINDVMLTCLAGALDRYRLKRENSVNQYEIRVGMPYNVRTSPKITELRNQFAFIINPIPLGIKDGYKRLSIIKKRMDYAKKLPEPWFGYLLSKMSSILPLFLFKYLGQMSQYLTAVLTNMVGGDEKYKFLGATVNFMCALVPPPDGVGIGVAVMSQAGKIYLSITTDKELIPDAQFLVECFIDEFNELKKDV